MLIYNRIVWTNTENTPLNAQNLNIMDNGIYNFTSTVNAIDKLLTYPNVSADCIVGDYQVTTGSTLTVENGCLNITGSGNSVVDISSDLADVKSVDTDRIMLIKLRIKKNSGTNLSVYFKYTTATDEVYVTSGNILASNLNTAVIGNPSYTITDDNYHDVWCIFDSQTAVDITGMTVEIAASSPSATISNFRVFYSMDTAGATPTGGEQLVNSVYSAITENGETTETVDNTYDYPTQI